MAEGRSRRRMRGSFDLRAVSGSAAQTPTPAAAYADS
jgi:hypothetical protein